VLLVGLVVFQEIHAGIRRVKTQEPGSADHVAFEHVFKGLWGWMGTILRQ